MSSLMRNRLAAVALVAFGTAGLAYPDGIRIVRLAEFPEALTFTPADIIEGLALVGWRTNAQGDAEARSYEYDQNGNCVKATPLPGNHANRVRGYGPAGQRRAVGDDNERAVLWDYGPQGLITKDLGTLGGAESKARGVNAGGKVVGEAQDANGNWRGTLFWWDEVNDLVIRKNLGTLPGGDRSTAAAINNAGKIVGNSTNAQGNKQATVFWWEEADDLVICKSLGTLPGGDASDAKAVNNANKAVGKSTTSNRKGDLDEHATLWYFDNDGNVLDLLDLGVLGNGAVSEALGINDLDQAVGTSLIDEAGYHAFIWEAGVMTDLNDWVEPGSPWVLESAVAISNLGHIVGMGTYNGQPEPFLVIPEPSTLGLLALGALAARRRSVPHSFQA